MAKFITIPVTSKGNLLVSTDNLVVSFQSTSLIELSSAGKKISLASGATFATSAVEAIITAATAINGPTLVAVKFPEGTTCTGVTVA